MDISELAHNLAKMYDAAPNGRKVTAIHLFGIKYSKIIIDAKVTPAEIVKITKLKDGSLFPTYYGTEIHKGMSLSKYVLIKEELINHI